MYGCIQIQSIFYKLLNENRIVQPAVLAVDRFSRMTQFLQARSQGLSSLPPLVVGTETLVAAGHVTI